MQIKTPLAVLAMALLLISCSTDGGASRGPRPDSAEWYIDAAVMNVERGDFPKALEHLDSAIDREGPAVQDAIVWKTIMTAGLTLGHREVAEACKSGIEAKPDSSASLRGVLQQAQRDSRQYAIEFLEGLGAFEKTLAEGQVALRFPFPSGSVAESPVIATVSSGDAIPEGQMADGIYHTLRRNQIRAVSEMVGAPDEPPAAQAKFDAGPPSVPEMEARLSIARYLAAMSPLFDREMLNDPKIRKIVLDRAEQWITPHLESENEDLKEAAEELQKTIEDERRDLGGKKRRLDRG